MTPDKYTNQELMLDVGDGHILYIQDWGIKTAKIPIIFLHGGPGSGTKDKHREMFDPETQRVIFYDQRGCGRSTPVGSLEHNTTDDSIADIEKIAETFKLEKFILSGGSWGSCLAFVYGIKHPEQVHAMVLRGIFTARQSEIDWFDKGLFRTFFPDVWDAYLEQTPASERTNPGHYHFNQALSKDVDAAKNSAYIYEKLEGSLLKLDDRYNPEPFETYDPAASKVEIHYLKNGCFLEESYIMDNAHKLTMPIWLLQGRYDMVCPPITAYELHHKLPHSELIWTVSGHKDERESWIVTRALLKQATGEN